MSKPSLIIHFRYVSVHHPLDYNQAMNDPAGIRKRLFKYLFPVIMASVIFNLPKFFETTAHVVNYVNEFNETETTVHLNVTKMRVDPIYSSFVNWSQLFVLGKKNQGRRMNEV